MSIDYKIIRSNRRTIGLEIKNGEAIVRAPYSISDNKIKAFVDEHKDWLIKHLEKAKEREMQAESIPKMTMEEIRELADKALKVIPDRVRHFAPLVGVTYGRITIRNQKSRWGGCSSKGNLNFNCLLMLTPPEVIDSVVVHELCHLKQLNHSERFYKEILRVYPNYYECDKWLKQHGGAIMNRMM